MEQLIALIEESKRISAGLKQIDAETGLTKYEISTEKTKSILSQVDANGLSGYARKGQATRATHMANVDEFGRNGYSQLASKAIISGNSTKARKGLITKLPDVDAMARYKSIVTILTNRARKQFTDGYRIGRCGKKDAYQLDHKLSIFDGFHNQISPLDIGSIANFEMIPWELNITKWTHSSINIEDLMKTLGKTISESNNEFNQFMVFINEAIDKKTPNSGAVLLDKFYESTFRRE